MLEPCLLQPCVHVAGNIWVALLVYRYLSNTAQLVVCVVYSVKDHRKLPTCSPLLNKSCVRLVVLDKWCPLRDANPQTLLATKPWTTKTKPSGSAGASGMRLGFSPVFGSQYIHQLYYHHCYYHYHKYILVAAPRRRAIITITNHYQSSTNAGKSCRVEGSNANRNTVGTNWRGGPACADRWRGDIA